MTEIVPFDAAVPLQQSIPLPHLMVDVLIPDKSKDLFERIPVLWFIEKNDRVEKPRQRFGLLPELFQRLRGRTVVGAFDENAAVLPIYAVRMGLIHHFSDNRQIRRKVALQHLERQLEQPAELDVMAIVGIVEGTSRFIHRTVRTPDVAKQNSRQRLKGAIELGHTGAELRMEHFLDQQGDDLLQFASMRRSAGQFVQGGEGFHEMHMHIQGFAVSAEFAARL